MPTPSSAVSGTTVAPSVRRSIFDNFAQPTDDQLAGPEPAAAGLAAASSRAGHEPGRAADQPAPPSLQASIDDAMARAFLYRWLAGTFENPSPEGWAWLTSQPVASALDSATATLTPTGESRPRLVEEIRAALAPERYDAFVATHLACFGHTVRGECPMNEIEYGDIKADPLFQPHRLADLGAFFAAFGLELAPDAAERIDHISIELEFMSVLAAKEAHALEYQFDEDALTTLRDAQRKFLREHLARWTPAFARRLARLADGTALGPIARLLGALVRWECARHRVPPGSEDLLLRPVDDQAERLCDSCGLKSLPPGATATEVPA